MENEKEYMTLDDEQLKQVLGGAKMDNYVKRADGNCPCCKTHKLEEKVIFYTLFCANARLLYCSQCRRGFMAAGEYLTELGVAEDDKYGGLIIYWDKS